MGRGGGGGLSWEGLRRRLEGGEINYLMVMEGGSSWV